MSSPWIDRPTEPRAGEELDHESLEGYLEATLGSFASLSIEQYPRGFSNLTYAVRAGERDLILRRPPFGARVKSGHDMSREFRVLSGLARVWNKAPTPVSYCEDESILGAPFYLMERLRGVILRSEMPSAMSPAPELMAAIAESWIDTLTELHGIDLQAAGLEDFGRPDGYASRQISGWTERYAAARTDDVPAIDRAAAWLAENLPPAGEATLIHNDFKYDNVVLAEEDWSRVIGVLDWEMATLGDPRMDLGTALGYWVDADDPPGMHALMLSPTTLPGNPTRTVIAERYAAASGRDVGDVVFHYVYGLFKIAVIVQQIYARYRQGLTSDPRFADLLEAVKACGRTAVQAIDRRRIDHLFD